MQSDIDEIATQLGEDLIEKILNTESTEVILAALDAGSPVWYQNRIEGISPLHAAAYMQNFELVKILIEKGAIWNAVDYLKNTAGDIALSFNNEAIYMYIRDAGIRSELLLGLLEKRPLAETSIILRAEDGSASGSSDVFLRSKLKYTEDQHSQSICMLEVDGEEVGVMMGWEKNIMLATVQKLCEDRSKESLRVLNVGFGLGLVDSLFQGLLTAPRHHVIIEAHPDVLTFMREQGWYAKEGVHIFEGRWQDFIESPELLSFGGFDVIYTDTFSEGYSDLRQFFEHLPDLLADEGSRFSFFNGLGATNALFYDIYTRISELHLANVGLDISWSDVDVSADSREDRWGKSREYFSLPTYRLPIGRMKLM